MLPVSQKVKDPLDHIVKAACTDRCQIGCIPHESWTFWTNGLRKKDAWRKADFQSLIEMHQQGCAAANRMCGLGQGSLIYALPISYLQG